MSGKEEEKGRWIDSLHKGEKQVRATCTAAHSSTSVFHKRKKNDKKNKRG